VVRIGRLPLMSVAVDGGWKVPAKWKSRAGRAAESSRSLTENRAGSRVDEVERF